jgi:hypothetical protein
MSVYLTIPSARPAAEAQAWLDKWRERGYKLAIWRDSEPVQCDVLLVGPYPGYARAVNALAKEVIARDPECSWMVAAADDIEPDPHNPDKIAAELTAHFHGTFGVMQPTGDPWSDRIGRMIERIAGSPWIGREFAARVNGGNGPYWHEYTHCFLDNEIMDVAKKYGCFLQRPDLTHNHRHWSRERKKMPGYLADANSREHWAKYSTIYRVRKQQGFPGSEPIAA